MRKMKTRRRIRRTAATDGAAVGPCPLCDRPMVTGPSLDEHHPLPRSHGGRATVTVHKICHRAIHAMLSERELAEEFSDFDKLRTHPMLAQFIAWVKKRPPEYYDRTRWSRSRRYK
ncbi:HNH endonuclease family protein [Dongia deserti]|uniref:HNH endonuclease n=1 Tax=Dongia deserti TaxID=2268030 RepID=UPI002547FEAB|nr:HNH endonuclease [Dongia deserti]